MLKLDVFQDMVANLNVPETTKATIVSGEELHSLHVRRAFAKFKASQLITALGLASCAGK